MMAAVVVLTAGCSTSPWLAGPFTSKTASASPTHSAQPKTAPKAAPNAPSEQDPIAGLSLQQRVGQLFMVGTAATAAEPATLSAVTDLHVGGIFLSGRSHTGTAATAAVVSSFTSLVGPASTGNVPLLVATDQEGGEVQVLNGPGFSAIPSALVQGTMPVGTLTADAATWGGELRAAGVNMDLAPVADLVPSAAAAAHNPPIGGFDREYGYDPTTIEQHVTAFRAGMVSAGVTTVVKHFPGLGFVTQNTDTSAGVTDSVTTADSASVGVYKNEIDGGASCVMVSSAVYSQIDPSAPAVFSPAVVGGLLRDKLGFDGVIMTDDLSAAAQVRQWSPADRAIMAIQAGVDIVLVSAEPSDAAAMVAAVVSKAQTDPAFDALVNDAARRVVELKAAT